MANQPEITIYTTEFPPYNYVDKNGELVGISTDTVKAVLNELGINGVFINKPWARIYAEAQNSPNSLIYSITRTKEREELFKWVTIIAPSTYSILAKKDRSIVIESLEDLKKYRIVTTNDAAEEQYLEMLNIPYIYSNSGFSAHIQNITVLLTDRVDLWASATLPAKYYLSERGLLDQVEVVYNLNELSTGGIYMAFSLETPDELVNMFREGFKRVEEKGIHNQLLRKYNIE